MAANGSGITNSLTGIHSSLKDMFAGGQKSIRTKTEKPKPQDIQPHWKFNEKIDKRILALGDYFYREGSFEKIQFARKWMRNALFYQGYHELEWSEINVAWDVIQQDSGDFAFPNNYYRTLVLQGVSAMLRNEPLIEPQPANGDGDAQAASKAAKSSLEFIKQSIKYGYLRVIEGINLKLFGNSFRFNYFSKDARYGFVTAPVYKDTAVTLSHGGSMCPNCGPMEDKFVLCPACGAPITGEIPPLVATLPNVAGSVTYPRGEIMTEAVNPLEVYLRSSSYNLWHAPFLVRNRMVDRLALQSTFKDSKLMPTGEEGGGEAYSAGGDLGLIYLQSLADLPGDPTQYAAWYERASAAAKALLVEAWIRPSQYYFDDELIKEFPDGMYLAKTGDVLLDAKNDTIENHWTHYLYNYVPGRIWGDGDDDIIPSSMKLDETDRLIQRNQGYNSSPLLGIDSQRVDKNRIINDPSSIIEVKSNGKPIDEAFFQIKPAPLSTETWQWRNAHIQDMQFHARISPAAVGMHQPGVNTFGGQESAAAKSDSSMLPTLMLWKTADEMWAYQVLKLASENWIDERIHSVLGINGKWEFTKLKGAALALDKITIITRVLPIDPTQQDSFSQAVASGLLDAQDPRVRRKAMELYHLPLELDPNYVQQQSQWQEIEQMKQTGKQIMPTLIMDNDDVHIDLCVQYWNSDEARANPQLRQLIQQHAELHVQNKAKVAMMIAAVQAAGQQVQTQLNPQGQPGNPQQPQNPQQAPQGGPRQPGGPPKQGGKHGGQVPPNPVAREQRAHAGQAAKPHRPQPPSGNQFNRHPLT